ncbi:MAG: hypothetical protein KJ077_24175 [Anaerolineae bacterium]|nr:hypothetical protein [Anaerolineae bacterium]
MEDDLLLEGQIKKKKRAVLLLLLTLLLVTAGAALLLEPAPLPSTAVARVETPAPTEPATPIAPSTPAEFQGDEWTLPTSPAPEDNRTTPATPTATSSAPPLTATRQTSTPTLTQDGTEASLTTTSDHIQADSASTVPPKEVTAVAGTVPTTDAGTFETTPSVENGAQAGGNDTSASTGEAAPTATEISQRINESLDVLDKYDSISGNEINISEAVTVTQSLTSTTTLSETVAGLPPDGLPITGMITPRKMNWMAIAMVILLIGTGVIALLYPKRLDT